MITNTNTTERAMATTANRVRKAIARCPVQGFLTQLGNGTAKNTGSSNCVGLTVRADIAIVIPILVSGCPGGDNMGGPGCPRHDIFRCTIGLWPLNKFVQILYSILHIAAWTLKIVNKKETR